ncbi:MAG: protein kinase [Cyanobacteria bacterium J083]|nr:MAG: protein kinase [Cyanobacteria bacterium J083]
MAIAAFLQGTLGASSLILGALVGVFGRPNKTLSAAIMAFGSGTLIAAIAFDITLNVYRQGGFLPLVLGFGLGSILFTNLTQYVDQHGGFLRQPACSRRYLCQQHCQEHDVLKRTAHVEIMQHMPEAEKQILANLLTPIYAQPGEILCREGDSGDYFYMIVSGEAEVIRGNKIIRHLEPGEIFGEMSLLTGEPRSATVVAYTPMELYKLDRDNFGKVLASSPYLAWALCRTLARRLQSATESQVAAYENLERWRQQLMDQVELDKLLREDPETLATLVQSSAPLAILVGTILDNIPESIVIGIQSGNNQIAWSFLLAVFISNFPEALASAAGMKQAGSPRGQILAIWAGIVILSGFFAISGHLLQNNLSNLLIEVIEALAGGAILAMLASTMMPEAYELGGSSVSYSTITGFLLGFLLFSVNF